jgi:ribosomal protein S18 acetylase RimI-like enzyme
MNITYTWLEKTTPAQNEELKQILVEAFFPVGLYQLEELTSYFDAKIVPRLEKGHLIHLASHQNRIVGVAVFQKWKKKDYYLAEMAITPSFHRQGIGRQLIYSLFEKEKGTDKLFLVTQSQNISAQGFYEKVGFKKSHFSHPDYPGYLGLEYSPLQENIH